MGVLWTIPDPTPLSCHYTVLIRGVTVHKIHGTVRYDTVVSRRNVGNISVLNHEGELMDITHKQCANSAQELCRWTYNLSQFTSRMWK